MSRTPTFPRPSYAALDLYDPARRPVDVDLSDNTNLWGTPPAALEAMRAAVSDDLARYPTVYSDRLREAAARRFGLGPGNVVTGVGSDGLLDASFRAAADVPGEVRYPDPTFVMIGPFARMNGRRPVAVPWQEAMDDPGRLLSRDTVVAYACRPNNPTGELPPDGWLDALLEQVGENGPLLVVDEAYGEFLQGGDNLAARAAEHPRLFVVRTLSKAFGLAGMRVGIGLGSPEVVREVGKARGPYVLGRLAEAAAVAALEDTSGFVDETVAESIAVRERLRGELEARELSPLPSSTNFLYLPLPAGSAHRTAAGLRERGVAVRPFPAMGGVDEGLRITVAPWSLMERFLTALDEVLAGEQETSGRP